jgi:hypothetical protein
VATKAESGGHYTTLSTSSGVGEEEEEVGKLSAAVDTTTTSFAPLDSSHHALLSLLFIALCVGFFITGIPSSITQCNCLENMCADNNNDKHQLHGSVQKRMNSFNQWVGADDKPTSAGQSSQSTELTTGLTNSGIEMDEEAGIEVDMKKGVDPKPKRSIFGSRRGLFGPARVQPKASPLLRLQVKSRPYKKEAVNTDKNDAVINDMYVRAEDG